MIEFREIIALVLREKELRVLLHPSASQKAVAMTFPVEGVDLNFLFRAEV